MDLRALLDSRYPLPQGAHLAQDNEPGSERQGPGSDDAARYVGSFNWVFDRAMEITDKYLAGVNEAAA